MSRNVPFGLRNVDGCLVPHPVEAVVVREIVEAFLRTGGRMKATAAALNAKGHVTRQGSRWSDVAVSRALRVVDHDGIVPEALRERCLALLGERSTPSGSPARRPVHPLGSRVQCRCGERMYLVGKGSAGKFVCRACRSKIGSDTLERLFQESLASIQLTPEEILEALADNPRAGEITRRLGGQPATTPEIWTALDPAEKQLLVDVAVSRIVVSHDQVSVVYALEADSGAESVGFSEETLPSSHEIRNREKLATEVAKPPFSALRSPTRSSEQERTPAPVPQSPGQPEASTEPQPKAYRIRQVSELLSLPKSTIYDLVRMGTLASVRTGPGGGGVVLIPAAAVAEFLERKKRRR